MQKRNDGNSRTELYHRKKEKEAVKLFLWEHFKTGKRLDEKERFNVSLTKQLSCEREEWNATQAKLNDMGFTCKETKVVHEYVYYRFGTKIIDKIIPRVALNNEISESTVKRYIKKYVESILQAGDIFDY